MQERVLHEKPPPIPDMSESHAFAVVPENINKSNATITQHTKPDEIANPVLALKEVCSSSAYHRIRCTMETTRIRISAQLGNAKSQDELGNFYHYGVFSKSPDLSPDFNKAIRWYRLAANQGLSTAQFKLYNQYSEQQLIEAGVNEPRIHWLTESAKNNHTFARTALGKEYIKGELIEKNTTAGLQWLHAAALANDSHAANYLNHVYASSVATLNAKSDWGLTEKILHASRIIDATEAMNYFMEHIEARAELGPIEEKLTLAIGLNSGNNYAINQYKAFEWMQKAAETEDKRALLNLGIMHFNGIGTSKNEQRAFELISAAAEQQYAKAQFFLGTMYVEGQGTEPDLAKAIDLLKQAANGGILSAKLNLADMYATGQGVAINEQKAEALRNSVMTNTEQLFKDFEGLVTP